MSMLSLIPANSQRSRATAIKAFEAFLTTNDVSLPEARARIAEDGTDREEPVHHTRQVCMVFGNKEESQGKTLARNTILFYFGNVKNWLVELHPTQNQPVLQRLQKLLTTINKNCAKRPDVGVVKQPPSCTKRDLGIIVHILYENASNQSDYLDAALVIMLCYIYGRGYDAEQLNKSQLCVHTGDMIFLRFKRVKTALQQDVSLFKNPTDMFTCPVHTLAVAMILHAAPGSRMILQFSHVPITQADLEDEDEVGLMELLDRDDEFETVGQPSGAASKRKSAPPGAQAFVNWLLASVSKLSSASGESLATGISSHSLRRGGAMHANADYPINSLWVVDRGGWNLSRVNKAFTYMLNVTQEGQQISRHLSGWNPQTGAALPDLSSLNAVVLPRVEQMHRVLFASAHGFPTSSWNLDTQVLKVMMVTAVLHYPEMFLHRLCSPYVRRIQGMLGVLEMAESELLS